MDSSTRYFKRSFAQGRISRDFLCRTDLEQYHESAFEVHNMLTKAHGPAFSRPGTKFIYDLSTALYNAIGEGIRISSGRPSIRLIPFVFSESQAYIIIFMQGATTGDLVIFFATDDGLVEDPLSPGDPYYIHQVAATTWFDVHTFDYAQYNDVVFLARPDEIMQELIRNDHDDWTLQNQTITSAPSDWTALDGYPSRVAIYEQRVVYGSNFTRPSTLWFSKSGYPYDFGVSSPLVASDAVTVTIGGGRKDEMQWMASQEKLVIGSLGSEHEVSGKGEPLAFDTVSATKISNISSREVRQVEIGKDIVFVQAEGQRIYRYAYRDEVAGYKENDLSVLSYDVTSAGVSFVSLAYQQQPYSIIWGVKSDGFLVSITIYGEHGVVAWHTHDTGYDSPASYDPFIDVECIPKLGQGSELWAAVWRQLPGEPSARMLLERMSYFTDSEYVVDHCILDSHTIALGTSTVDVTHLKGKLVSVMIDGEEKSQMTVPPSGILTLVPDVVASYTKACIGLPYEQRLTPTPAIDNRVQGEIIGVNQRAIRTMLTARNSGEGAVLRVEHKDGTVEDEPIVFRDYDISTTTSIKLFSGSIEINVPTRMDNESEYSIIQEHPIPLNILGITTELEEAI